MQRQAARGLHFFGTLTATAIELAARLQELIPCAERLAFTTTGSEATAYAMRIARAYTGRDKVLKFEGGYHGNHDYASFSIAPTGPANYPLASPDTAGVPAPLQDTMLVAPYNDLDVVDDIVREHRDDLAAIVVEPVQRCIFPVDGFLAGLRRIADENDVLLVFDEVVTGFRLALGGAQEYFGVQPDLASYGKIVGGGGPLGVRGRAEDIVDCADPRRKGRSDYAYINGNPAWQSGRRRRFHGDPRRARRTRLPRRAQCTARRPSCARCRRCSTRAEFPPESSARASLWQFLFAERPPRNQVDVLASDLERSSRLDLNLLERGVYVLPNMRRFVSAVHTEEDFESTLTALDQACAAM